MSEDRVSSWLKLENESDKAYAAFKLYLDLGDERSIREVTRQLSKSYTIIGRWSRTHAWVDRVRSYEQHLVDVEHAAREQATAEEAEKWAKRRAEQREADWALSRNLASSAAVLLQKLSLARVTAIDPTTLSAGDAARLLDTLVRLTESSNKLARLAAEMETDRQHMEVDMSQMSDDELDAIIAGKGTR